MPIKQIAEITGLSEKEIEALEKQYNIYINSSYILKVQRYNLSFLYFSDIQTYKNNCDKIPIVEYKYIWHKN